jgi:hypothetical protein
MPRLFDSAMTFPLGISATIPFSNVNVVLRNIMFTDGSK